MLLTEHAKRTEVMLSIIPKGKKSKIQSKYTQSKYTYTCGRKEHQSTRHLKTCKKL